MIYLFIILSVHANACFKLNGNYVFRWFWFVFWKVWAVNKDWLFDCKVTINTNGN